MVIPPSKISEFEAWSSSCRLREGRFDRSLALPAQPSVL